MAPLNKVGVIGAGSAALKKVISNPLKRRKVDEGSLSADDAVGVLGEDSINSVIEGEIIPRLLMAHSGSATSIPTGRKSEIAAADANRFASLPLELEAAGLLEEVDRFLAEGVSVDAIYIDLLAPTARRLGAMWESDECDFIDVTMGLWRLQEVMREIASRNPAITGAVDAPRSVLVSTMPGDQHTFGAQMIEEVFARAGWQSELLSRPPRRDLLDRMSRKPFDLLTLTVSRDCPSSGISSLIKAVRGVSVNPNLSIMIGGNFVNNNPAMVAEVGADGTGSDARAAIEVAERLVMAAPAQAQALR